MSVLSYRSVDSLVKMLPRFLELQEQLKRAIQDRDMETSHGICRLVVALGETHCRLDAPLQSSHMHVIYIHSS